MDICQIRCFFNIYGVDHMIFLLKSIIMANKSIDVLKLKPLWKKTPSQCFRFLSSFHTNPFQSGVGHWHPSKLVLVSIINALHVAKSKCQSPSESTCQLSQLIAPSPFKWFLHLSSKTLYTSFPSAPLAVSSQSPLPDPLLLDNLTALKCPMAQPMDINLFSSLYTHPLADSLQFHGF